MGHSAGMLTTPCPLLPCPFVTTVCLISGWAPSPLHLVPTLARSFPCSPGKVQTPGPGSQRPAGLPTSALLPAPSSVVDLTREPSLPSPCGRFTLPYPSGVGPATCSLGSCPALPSQAHVTELLVVVCEDELEASPPSQPAGPVRAAPRLPFLAGARARSRHSGCWMDGERLRG